mmetsp:Transcript_33630/g.51860  ORF Transcript_33630/g.51860 Transcript_33630/m.51860 type:complete len:252 (-) Transcript_33630:2353-3108(-)
MVGWFESVSFGRRISKFLELGFLEVLDSKDGVAFRPSELLAGLFHTLGGQWFELHHTSSATSSTTSCSKARRLAQGCQLDVDFVIRLTMADFWAVEAKVLKASYSILLAPVLRETAAAPALVPLHLGVSGPVQVGRRQVVAAVGSCSLLESCTLTRVVPAAAVLAEASRRTRRVRRWRLKGLVRKLDVLSLDFFLDILLHIIELGQLHLTRFNDEGWNVPLLQLVIPEGSLFDFIDLFLRHEHIDHLVNEV